MYEKKSLIEFDFFANFMEGNYIFKIKNAVVSLTFVHWTQIIVGGIWIIVDLMKIIERLKVKKTADKWTNKCVG